MSEIVNLLKEELENAFKAIIHLEYSLRRTNHLTAQKEYNLEELEKIEALTARFGRLADIIVQKLLKSIDIIDLDRSLTVRERLINGEKKGLIENHNIFLKIRQLRNNISHDYSTERFAEILKEVRELSPNLIVIVSNIKQYIEKKYLDEANS